MAIAGSGDPDTSAACKAILEQTQAAPGTYLMMMGPGYFGSASVPIALPVRSAREAAEEDAHLTGLGLWCETGKNR